MLVGRPPSDVELELHDSGTDAHLIARFSTLPVHSRYIMLCRIEKHVRRMLAAIYVDQIIHTSSRIAKDFRRLHKHHLGHEGLSDLAAQTTNGSPAHLYTGA